MKPYYKLTDSEYLVWLNNFINVVNANNTILNLTVGQIDDLNDQRTALQAKINARIAAEETLRAAVVAQQMARDDSQEDIAFYNKSFRVIPNMTDDLLEQLGLTVSEGASSPPPNTPLDLVAQGFSNDLNVLKWKRNENKPNTIFFIECKSGMSDGGMTSEWMQVGATSKTSFEHRIEKAGEQCIYRVYASRNDLTSPYSNEAVVYLQS
ncbi:MAG TPA: hypothetical protein VF596_10415 [Pyrinomonadaceae bacterium]|jgi:hypothetical protein